MQMMGMLIHHRHGKEPSHNSTAPVGGSTGERRGWLTDLLQPTTTASLAQPRVWNASFNRAKRTVRNHLETIPPLVPSPRSTTWTCCLRKSCAWRSDWSRSCRRRTWSASGRSRTPSRWMNEKRTCKRNITILSFLRRNITVQNFLQEKH